MEGSGSRSAFGLEQGFRPGPVPLLVTHAAGVAIFHRLVPQDFSGLDLGKPFMAVRADDRRLKFHVQHAAGIENESAKAAASPARLRIAVEGDAAKLRWIKLRYRSSFFEDPVRPLIWFANASGREVVYAMNGPVLGTGEWTGRVPDGSTSFSISPARHRDDTSFEMLSIEAVSRLKLIRRGLSLDRDAIMWSLGAKLIGAMEERWETLKFAATPTPMEDYADWYRKLHRPLDTNSIDRPHFDWNSGPAIRFMMPLEYGGAASLRATVDSLRRQKYQRWTVEGVSSIRTPPDLLAAFEAETEGDPRFRERPARSAMFDHGSQGLGGEYVALIDAGDTLADYATAVVAEAIARDPKPCVIYSDEDAVTNNSELHSPLFKPDWSPTFFAGKNYLGRLTCISSEKMHAAGVETAGEFVANELSVLSRICSHAADGDIRHVRRVLYHRRKDRNETVGAHVSPAPVVNSVPALATSSLPRVSVVIPTRDRSKLLRDCIESLTRLTTYPRYDVVIVDNGSTEADALSLLASLAERPDVIIVKSPGPFNFSALSNLGARATTSEMLVFLNNDTVIFEGNWLSALVAWAVRPEVGVVGAKLLFPNRTLEHAGVVLGHSGIAGHLYHGHSEHEPGHLGHLTVPHEVAAVTGACIAVRRDTFEAVGGFDEENLPVDLNDIDFCLKVLAKGLINIWTPHCVLYHLQSASRGFKFKPFEAYRKEREFFRRKWAHMIQDDPYFHPAFSLYSHRVALA